MDWLPLISIIVTAVATAVIAFFSWASYRLSKSINEQSLAHQVEVSDLYQAITIAMLINGTQTSLEESIWNFNKQYCGETKIFREG